MSYEVEQKYHVDDPADLAERLRALGGKTDGTERHQDTYYNHPCRDFAETKEALRIRRVDGIPHLTYKGTKLPGAVKARRELEWPLAPGDPDGQRNEELWQLLGFREVATVRKSRRSFRFDGHFSEFTVMIDEVDRLGNFAEIELVVAQTHAVESARQRILDFAEQLGLHRDEPRSYLRMFLGLDDPK